MLADVAPTTPDITLLYLRNSGCALGGTRDRALGKSWATPPSPFLAHPCLTPGAQPPSPFGDLLSNEGALLRLRAGPVEGGRIPGNGVCERNF